MHLDSISTFQPSRLPIRLPSKRRFQMSLDKAKAVIEQFNVLLAKHPIAKELTTFLSAHEAIDSLGSQHIKASVEDILIDSIIGKKTEREPVLDYLKAYKKASKQIRKSSIDHPFFFEMHAIIKGLPKYERRYRSLQNWIGPEGGPAEKAYFFPPAPATVASYMSNLITYWNKKEKEPLIQLAILFAQLLIIHPFMDGNGRIARLSIPHFLFQKGEMTEPIFFLSRYFKRHRLAYFQNLFAITSDGRWDLWIQFFLKGVHEQGVRDLKILKRLHLLYTTLQDMLALEWSFTKTKQVLLFLFQHPIFIREMPLPKLGRSQQEIDLIIDYLQKKKILKLIRRQGRSFLIFTPLLRKKKPRKS
ncbi:MAG: Fic family protein [Verrucomicrobia bacterium]|nr:Fic family protein [Verrucomicrobiota bacterium]